MNLTFNKSLLRDTMLKFEYVKHSLTVYGKLTNIRYICSYNIISYAGLGML